MHDVDPASEYVPGGHSAAEGSTVPAGHAAPAGHTPLQLDAVMFVALP